MLARVSGACLALLVLCLPARGAPYAIKVVKNDPPKELQPVIRDLLDDRCIQLMDEKSELTAEVWTCKAVPGKATEAQVKNGLTLREIPETSVVGALRLAKTMTDYRKQKLQPGVYSLRLAYQPQDGDHMGTAPYSDFCLVSPAADDKGTPVLPVKSLYEMSAKATGAHPGVFLLFPGKDATDDPKLLSKADGHWIVLMKLDVAVGTLKTKIGIGLTLIGTSPAA